MTDAATVLASAVAEARRRSAILIATPPSPPPRDFKLRRRFLDTFIAQGPVTVQGKLARFDIAAGDQLSFRTRRGGHIGVEYTAPGLVRVVEYTGFLLASRRK